MNIQKEAFNQKTLADRALKVREHVIRMSALGGCFIGASLSCVDLLVYLYSCYLKVDPKNFKNDDRDFFLLSKGHDVPSLYGTFAELGWLNPDRLKLHMDPKDSIYWHPNRSIDGVEFHSGSLGHLLPLGLGIAVDNKLKGLNNKVFVMTGDGELNEGSNWEALLVANARNLNNVCVVVDRNQFQANIRTEELIPLEPLTKKFEAFGFETKVIDGHSFANIHDCFGGLKWQKPQCVIANTTRGKGLPSIEARADRWFCKFSDTEVLSLIEELKGHSRASLQSETLTVR